MPLWSGLLGVAAIAGAYEYAFGLDPTAFTSQSVTAATTVLLAAAVGFLVGAVGTAFAGDEEESQATRRPLSDRLGEKKTTEPGDNAGVQILDKPAEA
jgi:hypothetical protein